GGISIARPAPRALGIRGTGRRNRAHAARPAGLDLRHGAIREHGPAGDAERTSGFHFAPLQRLPVAVDSLLVEPRARAPAIARTETTGTRPSRPHPGQSRQPGGLRGNLLDAFFPAPARPGDQPGAGCGYRRRSIRTFFRPAPAQAAFGS